ncbi:MAG: DUF4256 domain-containing protein [Microgenomates group bacterium]
MPKAPKNPSKPIERTEMRKSLSAEECQTLLKKLEKRFEENMQRHKGVKWSSVHEKLKKHPKKLLALEAMERSGGEPDVVAFRDDSDSVFFVDCSSETPKGRTSTCFDPESLESRKEHKPNASAVGMAKSMGVEILTEEHYRQLQELERFDTKTSSWVQTPAKIRKLGCALFCDRRYDTVFVYHNGAESYYGSRGFRGLVRV